MNNLVSAVGLTALVLVYFIFKRLTRSSLPDIRGPKSSSFILGNLVELHQGQAGEADLKWQSLYGNIIRFKGAFGEDQLMVSDPKALQRVFASGGYLYPKPDDFLVLSRILLGPGISWADGDAHRRQRKVLHPAFGPQESKALLTIFTRCAESVSAKWTEILSDSSGEKAIVNVHAWLSHAFLDAIGEAGFGVRFGAVRGDNHPLIHIYDNMLFVLPNMYNEAMNDIFNFPSVPQIFLQAVTKYIPVKILHLLAKYSSNPRFERIRELEKVGTKVAKEMVREKAESLLRKQGENDVFSLLVKANMDADAKNKLTEEELLAQMRTLLFAWSWDDLKYCGLGAPGACTAPQNSIPTSHGDQDDRKPLSSARGDSQFTAADFEAMPYTTAVMKEVLRYRSVTYHAVRVANRDDVLPLSQPITTESGKVINEVPVPKGTHIVASVATYNRHTELWGEDAHEFNPDRWLEGIANEPKEVTLGVYSNLMTFIGGVRGCLGWRFALIEMQAFLVELVGKFEFAMTDEAARIRLGPCLIMTPTVEGDADRVAQLPLALSIASRG
ncbi:cytochrome P450 [Melanogaster broomeanus]|nr:cytochrome P450 [Melanogaster broomeanus]